MSNANYQKEYRKKQREIGKCTCGRFIEDFTFSSCETCRELARKNYENNKEHYKTLSLTYYYSNKKNIAQKRKDKNKILKQEVFSNYGSKCACCEESIIEFLDIDHINNDGAEHRKNVGVSGSRNFYRWLKKNKFPKNFQILCRNCNWGKYVNSGVCPHKFLGE